MKTKFLDQVETNGTKIDVTYVMRPDDEVLVERVVLVVAVSGAKQLQVCKGRHPSYENGLDAFVEVAVVDFVEVEVLRFGRL